MAEMVTERGEMTPTKLVLFIAMLLIFAQAIAYFTAAGLGILYGIICLVFVFLIFVSLDLIGLGPIKIPYWWWLMLIIGVLLILFDFINGGSYLSGTLVILAILMELVGEKIKLEGCKFMVFFGILFGIWDCIVIFMTFTLPIQIVNAVFGLILLIILLILVFDLVDIKIPFNWWVVLIIAFVFWNWVVPITLLYPIVGFGRWLLMIGFVCMIFFK
jgi:hypothetical protein